MSRLHRETSVRAPLDETFAFFSDASNLERLTPPWVRLSIRTPRPIAMHGGARIEYRIRIHGLPMRWISEIDIWEPGRRFVDRQIAGPYRRWRHVHTFHAEGSGTRVVDDVEYEPPLPWLTGGLVRRDVERIFDYRQQALDRIFNEHRL